MLAKKGEKKKETIKRDPKDSVGEWVGEGGGNIEH